MKRLQKYTAALVSLLIIIIAFVVFVIKLTTISLQDGYESFNTEKLNDTLKIYRNLYGVPHVIAANAADAYFGMGYAHAQDRLWQMDYQRRAASGHLAEIFGDTALTADQLMRAINIDKVADRIWQSMDNYTRSLLEAYSRGVNFYIEQNRNRLPFEFDALSYKPAKWDPVDCLRIQRLFAFEQSISFKSDIILGDIAERIGLERASGFIPQYPKDAPAVFGDSSAGSPVKITGADSSAAPGNDSLQVTIYELQQSYRILRGFYDLLRQSDPFLTTLMPFGSGDAWVVRKQKYSKAPAIVSCDFQQPAGIPARFYEMHATCNDFNVTGMTIPGMPIFLAGRNDALAWGFAGASVDDFDLFIERIQPKDTNSYTSSNGAKVKFRITSDTIKVLKHQQPFYARSTSRSGLLSDIYKPDPSLSIAGADIFNKYCLTFNWTGNEPSDEFRAYYQIACARSALQLRSAALRLGAPAIIMAYSDIAGNYGMIQSGFIPKRLARCRPNFPNPAWIASYGWSGVQRSAQGEPHTGQPKHYAIAVNNLISHVLPAFESNLWDMPSRAEMIDSMLKRSDKYSTRDAQIMQNDCMSEYAHSLMRLALPALRRNVYQFSSVESLSLTELEGWDDILGAESAPAAIYSEFLNQLERAVFIDDLGEPLLNEYCSMPGIAAAKVLELLKDPNSPWFDDLTTAARENSEDIIVRAFRAAVNNLKESFNSDDPSGWRYGRLHTISLAHTLSIHKYLGKALDVDNLEVGGDATTVERMIRGYGNSRTVEYATTMRFIADPEDNDVQAIIAGGECGQPMSRNYSDQVQLWLNGGYIRLPAAPRPDENFKLRTVFRPGK